MPICKYAHLYCVSSSYQGMIYPRKVRNTPGWSEQRPAALMTVNKIEKSLYQIFRYKLKFEFTKSQKSTGCKDVKQKSKKKNQTQRKKLCNALHP